MTINHIKLYDLFRRELSLPDDKAAEFVYEIREIVGSESQNNLQLLATKNDISLLKTDGQLLKSDVQILKTDVQSLKEDVQILKTDVQLLKNDVQIIKLDIQSVKDALQILKIGFQSLQSDFHSLEIKLEQYKADIHRTIFRTSVVQFIAILGGVLAIVKFMK